MKKILSKPFDIHDYIAFDELEKLAEIVSPLPENTKTAYLPTDQDILKDNKNYALILVDGTERIYKYAHTTPELTALNLAFLSANINELPDEIVKIASANLTCAAKKFKIDIPLELELFKSSRFTKRILPLNAIDEVAWAKKLAAYKSKKGDIKKYALHGKYPIHTEEHIKKASEWFNKNYNKLSVDEITEFCDSIKKEIDSQRVTLQKKAMLSHFFNLDREKINPELSDAIKVRKAYLLEDEINKEAYAEVLQKAKELGTEKIASVIEFLDQTTGLSRLYGQAIMHPLLTATAMKKEAGISLDGKFITRNKLDAISDDDLTEIIGNDALRELKNDVGLDVFNSFPSPIKAEISKLIN